MVRARVCGKGSDDGEGLGRQREGLGGGVASRRGEEWVATRGGAGCFFYASSFVQTIMFYNWCQIVEQASFVRYFSMSYLHLHMFTYGL